MQAVPLPPCCVQLLHQAQPRGARAELGVENGGISGAGRACSMTPVPDSKPQTSV